MVQFTRKKTNKKIHIDYSLFEKEMRKVNLLAAVNSNSLTFI